MKKLWSPILVGVFGLAILLNLGFWQLRRLEWKENLIADFQAQLTATALPLASVSEFKDGMAVEMSGTFADSYTDKLTGDKHLGPGFIRMVPFEAEGRRFLVELGFLPDADKNKDFDISGQTATIIARVYLPEGAGDFDEARNLWVGYNLDAMTAKFNAEPVIMVAEESPVQSLSARPYRNTLPNNHLQYAWTWFLLALAWLAMTMYWGYSRLRNE